MEPTKAPVIYKYGSISDEELLNSLKHQAAQWFTNDNILLLEELFRRYAKCKGARTHV